MTQYISEVEDVKNYYADLLILQYHSKYKARETVKLGAEIYMGDGLVFDIQDVLDIDKAEGKQLDLIGKILDCPRPYIETQSDRKYFTFEEQNKVPTELVPDVTKKTQEAIGFSTSSNISTGFFKDFNHNYNSKLAILDDEYRILLKFKAIANRAIASQGFLDELFYELFGNAIKIQNNKDLSIVYYINDSIKGAGLESAIKLGYLEPPLGVGYRIASVGDFKLTVNTDIGTANVILEATGYKQIGNTITVNDGIEVKYTVSAKGYYTQTGTYTMSNQDVVLDLVMQKHPTLTINPTPTDSTVTIKAVGYQQEGNSISAPANTIINYTVERANYITQTNQILMNSYDETIDVELEQNVWHAFYNTSVNLDSYDKVKYYNNLIYTTTEDIILGTTKIYKLFDENGNILEEPIEIKVAYSTHGSTGGVDLYLHESTEETVEKLLFYTVNTNSNVPVAVFYKNEETDTFEVAPYDEVILKWYSSGLKELSYARLNGREYTQEELSKILLNEPYVPVTRLSDIIIGEGYNKTMNYVRQPQYDVIL